MKNFDEKIRDKVYDAEMPVSDHLWDFIDSQISTKKERPKYVLFFLASLILFPIVFLGINYYTSTNNTEEVLPSEQNLALNNNVILASDNLGKNLIERQLISDLPLLERQNEIKLFDKRNKGKVNLSFQIVTNKNSYKNRVVKENAILDTPLLLSNRENSALVSNFEALNLPLKFSSGSPQCPSFKREPLQYYLFANANISAPFQSLSSQIQENEPYIQRRNETESGYISYNFDVGVGVNLNDNLFIEGGLSYNRINNKFYLKEMDQIKNTTVITIDTTFDSNGSIIDIETNTFIVQEQGITETTALNSFTQIDIPLSVGYIIPVTPSLNVSASAGAIFNLRTSSKGTILNKKGEPMNIQGGISDGVLFKSQVGLSYIGSLKLETEIYPKIFVNTGINMRYYAQTFNTSTNPINQKYFSVGLGAGIKYML